MTALEICFWGIDFNVTTLKKESGDKTKSCRLHRLHDWVVSSDRDDEINVWDFQSGQRLLRKYVQEIFQICSATSQPKLPNKIVSSKDSIRPSLGHHCLYQSTAYAGLGQSNLFAKDILGITNAHDGFEGLIMQFTNQTESHLQHLQSPSSKVGVSLNILSVSFVDGAANHRPCFSDDTSSTYILILCETHLMLYDFVSLTGSVVSAAEVAAGSSSGGGKFQFNSAECVALTHASDGVLALGCSDGTLRIWHTVRREVLAVLHIPVATTPSQMVGKGVVALKLISTLRRVVDNMGTFQGFVRPQVGTSPDKSGHRDRIENIRFLVIGCDGLGMLWDAKMCISEVDNSITSVKFDETQSAELRPAASGMLGPLLEAGEVTFDEETNAIVTVTRHDKVISVWSCGDRAGSSGAGGLTCVSQQKPLTTALSSASTASSAPGSSPISLAAAASLQPQKISSVAVFKHPRFVSETFVACSKSPAVALLSGSKSAVATLTSKPGAATEIEKTGPRILYEANVAALLMSYLDKVRSRSDSNIPAGLLSAVSETLNSNSLKVYSARTHASRPGIVALATSLGVLILRLAPALSDDEGTNPGAYRLAPGPFVAQHPAWGEDLLRFSMESCRLSRVVVGVVQSTKPPLTEGESSMAPSVAIKLTLDTSLTLQTSSSSSAAGDASVRRFAAAMSTYRPTLLVSPSGRFVCVFWEDGSVLIILSLTSGARGSVSAMREVYRTQAESFGWVGTDDVFSIISPSQSSSSPGQISFKRLKATSGGTGGAQSNTDSFRPELVGADEIILAADSAGTPRARRLCGGIYLCLAGVFVGAGVGADKSKAGFTRQEQGRLVGETVAGKNVSRFYRLLRGSNILPTDAKVAGKHAVSPGPSSSTTTLSLEPIGPVIPVQVLSVSWDLRAYVRVEPLAPAAADENIMAPSSTGAPANCDATVTVTTWRCAVLLDATRINIISFSFSLSSNATTSSSPSSMAAAGVSVSTVASVGLLSPSPAFNPHPPSSLHWHTGLLFTATSESVVMIAPVLANEATADATSSVEMFTLSSAHEVSITGWKSSFFPRRTLSAWLDIACVRGSSLVLASNRDDGMLCVLPIASDPLAALETHLHRAQLMLAMASPSGDSGDIDGHSLSLDALQAALEWACLLPFSLHNVALRLFARRGFLRAGMLLPGVTHQAALWECEKQNDKIGAILPDSVFELALHIMLSANMLRQSSIASKHSTGCKYGRLLVLGVLSTCTSHIADAEAFILVSTTLIERKARCRM